MSAPEAFRPVSRDEPCAICGKVDWCRRTADGAHECHRTTAPAVDEFRLIATTPAGYGVYRRPEDRQRQGARGTDGHARRPRVFDSPRAAANDFAAWKKGIVEHLYRWTDDWYRARIRLPHGKAFCEVTRTATGWVLRGPCKPRQLYRVSELPPEGVVAVCEGEKASDAAWSIGVPCVTSGAADSAKLADWTPLRGREVAVFPDRDVAGARYATDVAHQLWTLNPPALVKIVELPGLEESEDFHDFVEKHKPTHSPDQAREMVIELISKTSKSKMPTVPTSSPDEWPAPQPLPADAPLVMPFDPDLLPSSLRPWIADIADRVQCPIDFPAVAVMVALAAIVGRKVGIRPKRYDDWLVVPNLWGGVIGRPGVMKTPAIAEVLKPLKQLELEAKEVFERAVQDYEAAKIVQAQKRKEKERDIRKAIRDGADALAIASELLVGDAPAPRRRRYMANDATVEKLGELLNQNRNGLLVFRDELIGLLKSLDREGQEGARAFYLEAWNGVGRFTYDRIERGTLDIEACCLSVIGGIQPGVIGEYLRAAARGGKGDDGLIQRFQLLVWPNVSKTWCNVDRWPDTDARRQAYATFLSLDALDVRALETKSDGSDVEGIPYLRFADDAQGRFDAWRATLEHTIRCGEEHPALEAHLAKYRSLVPTLALLIHLADEGIGPVTVTALERAIGWARYLESHARKMYAQVTSSDILSARNLAQRILDGALGDEFSLRDVYRRHWSALTTREEARQAVAVLMDHGWLVAVREDTAGAPRTKFLVNPAVRISDLSQGRACQE